MRFEPYEYQRVAVEWVMDRPRCCLFLDMGLGKSVITLTAVRRLIDDSEVSRVLVVAPKKVAETTWTDEASKWDHLSDLRVVKVTGTERRRLAALEEDADVYVIGRDSFVWLVDACGARFPFDMVVLDELTSFKSSKSQRFKAMRRVSPLASRVVGLTGTPAPNGLIDLWAEMYCVDLGKSLGTSKTRFENDNFNFFVWNNIRIRPRPKPGAELSIKARLVGACLSMRLEDYLQLPDMVTTTLRVGLPEDVRQAYDRFERDSVLEFRKEHDGEPVRLLAVSAAALMVKLSQFANGAVYDAEGYAREVHSEKLQRLAELVEEAGGNSVLVFYQYRHDIPRIKERLKGRRVETYEGPAQLEAWNKGEIDVLLAHPASTAYGLNMQGGGHYIAWFGTGWNLELYSQANARLHRQGQRHPVMVYRLLAAGTVDERAAAALDGKRSVQEGLLESLKYLTDKYKEDKL